MSYEGASTTRLVRFAAMSEGMLFYYFKNKRSLFKLCMEYALERVNNIGLDETEKYWDDFEKYLVALKKIYYKGEYQ